MSEQDRVRRLLGDLRATDEVAPPPLPDDVAARLDARLAEAARAESPEAPETREPVAPVVPLRRRLAPLLVAAALVLVAGGAVVGLGLGQGGGDEAATGDAGAVSAEGSDPGSETSGDTGSDGAGTAADPTVPSAPADGQSAEELAPDSSGDSGDDTGGGTTTRMTAAPYLTAADFAADARALVRGGEVATADDPQREAVERERVQDSGCAVPGPDLGAATLVSLDGAPAVLVVGPADGDEVPVDLRDCLGSPVDATTVPAP